MDNEVRPTWRLAWGLWWLTRAMCGGCGAGMDYGRQTHYHGVVEPVGY